MHLVALVNPPFPGFGSGITRSAGLPLQHPIPDAVLDQLGHAVLVLAGAGGCERKGRPVSGQRRLHVVVSAMQLLVSEAGTETEAGGS